jgi:hypothetical protein
MSDPPDPSDTESCPKRKMRKQHTRCLAGAPRR